MNEVISYKGSSYVLVDGGLLKGYTKKREPVYPEGVPTITWHGNKMPHRLWVDILAFFAWTYDTYKDEALIYLYYNEATGNWLAWAPPQKGAGMTVKTEENHPGWAQAEEFVGYIKVGTAHHHCLTNAFQSGTDKDDECTGNGLHYTVGNMEKQFHDLHARAVFNGNMIEVDLDDWVELADRYQGRGLEQWPELLSTAYDYSLQARAPKDHPVPQQWKDNFLRTTYSNQYSSTPVGFHTGHTSNPNGMAAVKTDTNGVKTWGATQNGYYRTVNGKSEWISTIAEKKSPVTEPALRAEAELERLRNSGLHMIQLAMIAEELTRTHRSSWTGDRDTMAVIDILNRNGLNARWLEKYVEDESFLEAGKSYGV